MPPPASVKVHQGDILHIPFGSSCGQVLVVTKYLTVAIDHSVHSNQIDTVNGMERHWVGVHLADTCAYHNPGGLERVPLVWCDSD